MQYGIVNDSTPVAKKQKIFRNKQQDPELDFVILLMSPGIDFQPGGPVRQPYLTYRLARLHRLVESIPWNRFLGSLNVYTYGLSMEGFFSGNKLIQGGKAGQLTYTEQLNLRTYISIKFMA